MKVHDQATPGAAVDGTPGDGITWKWFAENDERVGSIMDAPSEEPRNLCKKTIIGGNLVVHIPPH